MNYFRLVNNCLLELNYKQVESFADLYKGDHKRILENLNRVNFEVCSGFDWLFLQHRESFEVLKGEYELPNPAEGTLKKVFLNGNELKYTPNYELFYAGRAFGQVPQGVNGLYSCFEDRLLIAPPQNESVLDVYYVSNQYATDFEGVPKAKMETAQDESVLPMPYRESILVYGACMKLKGNPEHNKFKFWFSLYNEALANLRARALFSGEEAPKILMRRRF